MTYVHNNLQKFSPVYGQFSGVKFLSGEGKSSFFQSRFNINILSNSITIFFHVYTNKIYVVQSSRGGSTADAVY